MANKWKVWIEPSAFREGVLKSADTQKAINDVAEQIKNAAGEGYAKKPYVGRNRAGAIVYPDTPKAYYSNLRNNTLLKAIKGV